MDLLTGNAYEAETLGTGWFLGFSQWTRRPDSDLLHVPQQALVSGLCMKWFDHPEGQDGGAKPVSEGRTVSILVSQPSRFQLEFSDDAGFPPAATRRVLLERPGDFAAWGAGVHHRWHCLQRSTILTLRWNPVA